MTRKKTHKQIIGNHPVPVQSHKYAYVNVFFLFLIPEKTISQFYKEFVTEYFPEEKHLVKEILTNIASAKL